MKRVIFNQKGGVGKTSITCNLAAAMAHQGQRVLVVDLDTQANATQYLLGHDFSTEGKKTIVDFFQSTLGINLFGDSLRDMVLPTEFDRLWIIPSDPRLSDIQSKLESRYKIFKFSQALTQLCEQRKFDAVFIDTPPILNFFTMSALIAADKVLIPFDGDSFSKKALDNVVAIIKEVASDHKPDLALEGVIINHFQAQAKLPQEVVKSLHAEGLPILSPYLSASVVMKESHQYSKPLVYFKPQHKLSQEYLALGKSLLPEEKVSKISKASKTSKLSKPSRRNAEEATEMP